MLQQGHLGVSLVVLSAVIVGITSIAAPSVGVVLALAIGVVVTGNLPDIDQNIPFVTHRGITHTVWFAVGIGVTGASVAQGVRLAVADVLGSDFPITIAVPPSVVIASGVGCAVGVCAHLLGDMITPWGVRPFRPLSDRRIRVKLTTASNSTANLALLILGGMSAVGAGLYYLNPLL